MADLNNESQELAAVMRQVNQDLANFGKLTSQTAEQLRDAQMKAKYGVDNFTAGVNSAGGAIGKYIDAHTDAAKAVYKGERGAAAFNKSLDGLTEAAKLAAVALSVMVPGGPLIKGLVAGLTLLAAKVYELSNEYTKAANTMSDTLFKGFQDMSAAGGSASDGMKGLFEDTKKLGLSMSQLDTFVQLVNKNSHDLALFGGTVFEGRKKFAAMGEAMETSRQSLMNMGLTQEQINEGAMSYLRLQTRLGNSQKMTTDQLAEGARKYLVEQDALTKLTGATRQEQEDMRQEALTEQMFAAQIRELQIKGDKASLKAAEELQQANIMATKVSKEFGAAFRASVTGNLLDPAAQKLNMSAQGEQFEQIEKLKAGTQNAAGAITEIGRAIGKSGDNFGVELAKLGVADDFMLKFGEVQKIRIATEGDLNANLKKISDDQAAMGAKGGKAADAGVAAQVQLTLTQQKANEVLERFVEKGVVTATQEMIKFAEKVEFAGKVLGKISNGKFESTADEAKRTSTQGTQLSSVGAKYEANTDEQKALKEALNDPKTSERDKAWIQQQLKNVEARAVGGPVNKGEPYLVGEKGPELFVPKADGKILPSNSAEKISAQGGDVATATNISAQKVEQIQQAVQDIIDDTKKLGKITETDTIRVAKFSDLQKKFLDLKTNLLQAQVENMEEQAIDTRDISSAIKKLEKITDADLYKSQKYSETQKKYFDLKTSYYNNQISETLDMVSKESSASAVGPVSSASAPPSGTGLKAPAAGAPPSGGTGLKIAPPAAGAAPASGAGGAMSQSDLSNLGLKIKAGDVQAEGAGISPKIIGLAEQVQANMPNFSYFSGFNDKFHQEKSPSSFHTKGQAMDFALNKTPSKEEGQEIVNWLKSMGASYAIDEYNNPSSKATAGHIHAQIAGYADGGIAEEPQIAMVAEKGPEAMVPLKNGAIPVEGFQDAVNSLRAMQEQMSALALAMSDMVREQRNTNDISAKILQVSAN